MSFTDCLLSAAGENDLVSGQDLVNEYSSRVKKNIDAGMSQRKAELKAQNDMIREASEDAFFAREMTDNAIKFSKIMDWIEEATSGGMKTDEAVSMFLDRVNYAMSAEEVKVNQILVEVQDQLKVNFFGRREPGLNDAVGEMLFSGKFDGSQAGKTAQALRRAASLTEIEFKAAGGRLSPRKNFIPEIHDPAKMRARLKGESVNDARIRWVNEIRQTHKVMDPTTGDFLTDENEITEALVVAYDRIVTRGQSDFVEDVVGGSRAFLVSGRGSGSYGGRRVNPKVLHANSYDDWVKYNLKYGAADSPVDALIRNMRQLAKETAVLKNLGTNPMAAKKALLAIVQDADDMGVFKRIGRNQVLGMIESKMEVLTTAGKFIENDTLENFVDGVTHLTRAATLGMGGISAFSDVPVVRATGVFAGLDTTRMTQNYFKFLAGQGSAEREVIERTGYLADTINGSLHLAERDSSLLDTVKNSKGKMALLSRSINTASGLAHVTNVGRMVAHLESVSYAAQNAKIPWGKLNKNYRATLIEAGVSKENWGVLNSLDLNKITYVSANGKVRAIHTGKLRAMDPKNTKGMYALADALDVFSSRMQAMAVSENSLSTKAFIQGGNALSRIPKKLFFMYKTFPLTVMANHIFAGQGVGRDLRFYRARLVAATTIFGYISLSAKDVLNGKSVRDPRDPQTVWQSFLAGGTAGMFNSFLDERSYSFGNNPVAATIMTPTLDLAGQSAKVLYNGAKAGNDFISGDIDAWEKSSEKLKRESYQLVRKITPFKNWWATNLLVERTLIDGFRSYWEDDFEGRAEQQMKRLEKSGQRYLWAPGEEFPGFDEMIERAAPIEREE